MNNNKKGMKLGILSFGIALGLTNGLGMLLLALAGLYFSYGLVAIQEISLLYHGYAATFVGGLYGLGWGFLDGFIFGIVVAIIYNLCMCCCSKDK